MPAGVGSSSTAAGDPQCGHGVREADSGGDGGELDGALLDSAVAGVGGAVRDRDLRPGQRGEFGEQPRLVGLDGEQVVGSASGEVGGVAALGVQGVRGDEGVGDVQAVQQRSERRYLVGLSVHAGLGEHCPGGGVERSEQVHRAPVICAGAAHGLPVHGDDPTSRAETGPAGEPLADARSSWSASRRCSTRRIVDSDGGRRPRPSAPS